MNLKHLVSRCAPQKTRKCQIIVANYIKFTGNLSWHVSFYGNWDNRPPGNLPGSDYGTSSGLSWAFGSSLRTAPPPFNSQECESAGCHSPAERSEAVLPSSGCPLAAQRDRTCTLR